VYINSRYTNPYAHTSHDTIDHIDPRLLARAVQAIVAAVLSLSNGT
jgi:hypothetical protein